MQPALEQWLWQLPKIELHVHLEGSMSVQTLGTLAARHGLDTTSLWPNGLPSSFSFTGFFDFARQYLFGLSLLRTGEDLATVADDLVERLAGQNVRYAEVTTTAFSHFVDRLDRAGMSQSEYTEGLNEGRKRAAERGVTINWVVDIPRVLEPPESRVTIDYLESLRAPDGLVAIGLGGYEPGYHPAPYRPHFERARAIGLHSVPHAGETAGAEDVRSAVLDLGAERIGHGIRCLDDPDLVELLVERDVMLEVCPTSNVRLGAVESLEAHPLPQLLSAGINTCLNTDDPGWFATDLVTELHTASQQHGLDRADHLTMQRSALDASFAEVDLKRSIQQQLDEFENAARSRV